MNQAELKYEILHRHAQLRGKFPAVRRQGHFRSLSITYTLKLAERPQQVGPGVEFHRLALLREPAYMDRGPAAGTFNITDGYWSMSMFTVLGELDTPDPRRGFPRPKRCRAHQVNRREFRDKLVSTH